MRMGYGEGKIPIWTHTRLHESQESNVCSSRSLPRAQPGRDPSGVLSREVLAYIASTTPWEVVSLAGLSPPWREKPTQTGGIYSSSQRLPSTCQVLKAGSGLLSCDRPLPFSCFSLAILWNVVSRLLMSKSFLDLGMYLR